MKRLHLVLLFVVLLFLFVFFCLRGGILLDADFGWHVRMGQIILKHGLPVTDVFSYTMPSFPMVDHEWLTNVVLALGFPLFGLWGLAVLFAGLAIGSLWIQLWKKMGNYGLAVVSLLVGLSMYSFVGIRPQVITWFLFSIFVVVLVQKRWQKLFWFLPLLQLVWVNLHGGFAVGVFLVGLVFVLESLAKRKIVKKLLVVFSLCILASFLNPYGVRIWGEVFMQLSDSSLRLTITEWKPAIYFSNIAFWILVILFVFFVGKNLHELIKTHLVQLGCAMVFCVMAFSSMRHIPLWMIVLLSLIASDLKKVCIGRWMKVVIIFFLCALLLQVLAMIQTLQHYSEALVYPVGAVHYLQKHQAKRIFALYDWNSFILWQLPGAKVFIDGMMPSWRWGLVSNHESSYAFWEYREVLMGKIALRDEVRKYGIDCVMLPAKSEIFDERSQHYSISGLERQVKEMGWRNVYRDGTAVIYTQ